MVAFGAKAREEGSEQPPVALWGHADWAHMVKAPLPRLRGENSSDIRRIVGTARAWRVQNEVPKERGRQAGSACSWE